MDVVLEATAITVRFGGVVAVNAVDFSLRRGELRCLIGPNGAGKSSFFKVLSGQLRPSLGRLRLKGQDITGRPGAAFARMGVGIKTQVPNVFDGLSVYENVYVAARRVASPKQARLRAAEMLERMRVAHLSSRIVGVLAHGQRQLVELAMVIAPAPDVILLDEPAAGMTGAEVERLGDFVVDLAKSSAVVVVEHDMDFVQRIAQTVTVFNQGSVLMEGGIAAVMNDSRVQDIYLGRDAP